MFCLLQILTIMDCMHPTSLTKGCCVIQEGDDGSTVYVLEGEEYISDAINCSKDKCANQQFNEESF